MVFHTSICGACGMEIYMAAIIRSQFIKRIFSVIFIAFFISVFHIISYGEDRVYDLRQNGMVTSVKNRGEDNTCYAFAIIAAIENNLIKQGLENNTVDLSEEHLAYFFYNRQQDRLKLTSGDRNVLTSGDIFSMGGNIRLASVHLMTGVGVAYEYDVPYRREPNPDKCYNCAYQVDSVFFYDNSIENIKNCIKEYGAAAAGMYMDESLLSEKAAYYTDYPATNHAVTIVGWDDDYSRENFCETLRPQHDGAWIVKESRGESYGDNGYLYVSYEDKSLSDVCAFKMRVKEKSYENVYQYDGTACPEKKYIANGSKISNVFQVCSENGICEELKAVSICTYSENVGYAIQIYVGLSDGENPESGRKVFGTEQRGLLKTAGCQTIKLKKNILLNHGEKYSVVITLSGESKVYVGNDKYFDYGWIIFNSVSLKGQSFIKKNDMPWKDYCDYGNFRIKAYTDNLDFVNRYSISNKKVNLKVGKTKKLAVRASSKAAKRIVYWSVADKKIATITANGKIKAKKAGKTTAIAKMIYGDKYTTFKCKVNIF